MTRYQTISQQLEAEPKRWLITGVAGFIGSALLERLLGLGQDVVGIDNFATGHQHNIDDVLSQFPDARFTFVEGSITDGDACKRACDGVDYVLHQAALGSVPRSINEPRASHHANVNGFLELMLSARDAGVKRAVYASSSSVYGDHPGLPKVEERIGRQLSPYAITKRVDELYAGVIQDCYGTEIIGLRYFNVFGRRQDPLGAYAAVIPRWVDALLGGRGCQIFGDGSNSRDFCYVDNAVQANILAATTGGPEVTNTVYNVGCGGRTTLVELFEYIRDGLAEMHPEVADAQPEFTEPRAGDVLHSQANIDKIREKLGYEHTHEIREGLRETVHWFAERAGKS
ncbi:SDR family oxidoreductase [Haliangium ochraceum]|uniref:NAD-dependent epimerase/dehydratase n=1 Tax=Haliangium ochraceum (strain DSM 14365 / JCM 11303 / SMP-2) TaxID=502025 RepID=D0LWP6_HALO1|nr:SDR family oxidoreductase [Haliangium ochraceum]ACY17696.1 NAD-dependent epimerase/dehydratase [Haliangium ochraceum DSM 14365]